MKLLAECSDVLKYSTTGPAVDNLTKCDKQFGENTFTIGWLLHPAACFHFTNQSAHKDESLTVTNSDMEFVRGGGGEHTGFEIQNRTRLFMWWPSN